MMEAGPDHWVEGEGWVSDEGPFLGSEATRHRLTTLHPGIARPGNSQRMPITINDDDNVVNDLDAVRPSKRARLEQADQPAVKATGTDRTKSSVKAQVDVLDFLKTRPQLAKLDKKTKPTPTAVPRGSRNVAGETVKDLIANTRFEGHTAAWQQSETVIEFLRRLPVESPATASVGPWLWVGSPQYPRHWLKSDERQDHDAFMDTAQSLFADFATRRVQIEQANPGKAVAQITRKLGPDKDVLERRLLQASVTFGETSGKWMLFPGPSELPRVWRCIAEATAGGELGPTSKVGTWEPGNDKKGTLVCVYTYDFTDLEDVRRVLDKLVNLGLATPKLKTIYYKCDAYTYLDLGSNNEYKIRASLWSSEEVLKKEVGITEDGQITRLTKRHVATEKF
ncbi:hypothetical protein B0A48_13386 [Cryoendolithus antarcticus]|uniref:DUF1917 domain-containing protein n=1 Tax=Cryoendolithus antarcticus TaxID=1507870 RepID=A0A1V8SPS7_9PEZI|nr:hypothetical protein B0A48_13386 [Cryoendolithus antarcticus]